MIHFTHYCPHQAFLIGSVQSLAVEGLVVEGLVAESPAVEGLVAESLAAVVRQPCLLPAASWPRTSPDCSAASAEPFASH